AAGPADSRGAGRRAARADLAARIEPLQRAARCGAGPAVRVRVAFRARSSDGRAAPVSHAVPAVGVAGAAACDGRRVRLRGGDRSRGAAAVHVAAAGVRQPAARAAGAVEPSGREHRRIVDAGGAGGDRSRARVCGCRIAGNGAAGIERDHRSHRRRRVDADGANLRSRGAAAIVRDRGGRAGSAGGRLMYTGTEGTRDSETPSFYALKRDLSRTRTTTPKPDLDDVEEAFSRI